MIDNKHLKVKMDRLDRKIKTLERTLLLILTTLAILAVTALRNMLYIQTGGF